MHLRHQALTVLLAAGCCCAGGCARILGAVLAPQQAAVSAANQVAGSVTSPARSELAAMNGEVSRLLNGDGGSREELARVQGELRKRLSSERRRDGAAQDDPQRMQPWHPRSTPAKAALGRPVAGDELAVGKPVGERGLPANGLLPDGIPAAEMRSPIDLRQIRLEPRR